MADNVSKTNLLMNTS